MNGRSLLFGFNCYLASMAALWIAFSFELPNPWWAVITVFLTSQPSIEGAVWAKAAFRVGGTVIGLVAALAIIPTMVDAPELMLVALATWLAVCVYVSLQDRTPRGYLPLLAGYGAILVGLPVIDNPVNIFTTAVARTEEILIGVVCASAAHGLIFPRSVHGVLNAKVHAAIDGARGAIIRVIDGTTTPSDELDRLRFSAATIDVALQASVLAFEPPRGQSRAPAARALAERLAALLPLLSAVDDRLHQLPAGRRSRPLRGSLHAARMWFSGDGLDAFAVRALEVQLRAAAPAANAATDWSGLVEISLAERLCELAVAWHECLHLAHALATPDQPLSATASRLVVHTPVLSLHVDQAVAGWSALNAALALLVCGGLALWIQWPPATVGIGIAAVLTSLFATFDDPTPIMRKMLVWTLVSIPIGAVYVFAILPLVDGFVPLAIVLFPVIAVPAALMTVPRHALRALSVLLVSTTVIGIQPSYHGDMEAFANLALSSSLGTTVALLLTQAVRVMEGQWVARRIKRSGWRDLSRLARRPPESVIPFAMRMLDRVGLLLPRIPPASRVAAGSLRDLRIGVGLSELMALGPVMDESGLQGLVRLRESLGAYFDMLAVRPDTPTPTHVTDALTSMQPAVLSLMPYRTRLRAVSAWVGLRHTLTTGDRLDR
jgi:uncharacterized membrane protein YccC